MWPKIFQKIAWYPLDTGHLLGQGLNSLSSAVCNMELRLAKRFILENLLTPPRWGGRHTELRNIKKGLPASVTSTKEGQRLVTDAIKELVNDGWLLAKKSTGNVHVSLNSRKKKEIMEFVLST